MDNEILYITGMLLVMFLVSALLIFVIGWFVYLYQVNVAGANFITVYIDGNEIYQGKKAFVDISSGGMTTTITIYRGLFPFHIIDKVYSSRNVEVK